MINLAPISNSRDSHGDNFGSRRFLALDGWRGICAVLVALMHFHTTGSIATLGVIINGHLFVDFFFVLSGFVLSHAYLNRLQTTRDAASMIWRRIGRLWPLHLATLAALISIELAGPIIELLTDLKRSAATAFAPDGSSPLAALPTNIVFLHGLGIHDRLTWNVPSWSISVEFWTYVVFAIVVVAYRGRTLVPALALAVMGLIVVAGFSPAFMATENGWGFFRCLAGFFAGHLVYRLLAGAPVRLTMPNTVEAVTAVGVLVFVALSGGTSFEFAAPIVFTGTIWVFAHEQGVVSTLLKSRPLQLLGLWSFSIYMVHTVVITIIHRALTVVGQVTGQELAVDIETDTGLQHTISFANSGVMDLATLLYIAIVVAVSASTWRWIEQPAGRYWNGPLWELATSRQRKKAGKIAPGPNV